MKTVDTYESYVHTNYESLHDLIVDTPVIPKNERIYQASIRDRGSRWFGFRNAKEVIDAVEHGWKEGAERIQRELEAHELPQAMSVRRRRVKAGFGDSIDMQSVYAGSLDRAWDTTKRERVGAKGASHAVVYVEMATRCDVTPEQAFWRGACATMVSDMLQRTGRSVKIVLIESTTRTFVENSLKDLNTITAKGYDQSMDMETIAAVTSIGFFRVLVFKAKACKPFSITPAFGYPASFIPEHIEPDAMKVVIHKDILSRGQAEQFLNNTAEMLKGEQQ